MESSTPSTSLSSLKSLQQNGKEADAEKLNKMKIENDIKAIVKRLIFIGHRHSLKGLIQIKAFV
jgi:hypothetical protein